ncbi:hypothetical protein V8F20_003988 [Naviculisporaceae sp. PSN 640]
MDPATEGHIAAQVDSAALNYDTHTGAARRQQSSAYRQRVLRSRRRERRRRTLNPPHFQPSRRRSRRLDVVNNDLDQVEDPTPVQEEQANVEPEIEDVPVPEREVPDEELPPIRPYWPNIVAALETKQSGGRVGRVNCPVCDNELVIDGIQEQRSEANMEEHGITQERGFLAACGHVFGSQCLSTWSWECAQKVKPFTCPSCRFNLDPPRCRQHYMKVSIPLARNPGSFRLLEDKVKPLGDEHMAAAEHCLNCDLFRTVAAHLASSSEPAVFYPVGFLFRRVTPGDDWNDMIISIQEETDPTPGNETRAGIRETDLDFRDFEQARDRVAYLLRHTREGQRFWLRYREPPIPGSERRVLAKPVEVDLTELDLGRDRIWEYVLRVREEQLAERVKMTRERDRVERECARRLLKDWGRQER